MPKHNNLTELFTATANAIRSKTGSTDPIVADDFPTAIEGIEAGGGGVTGDFVLCGEATEVAVRMFSSSKITGVDLPFATSIDDRAFEHCDNITSIDLPVATSIGEYAFIYCKSLPSIDLPAATSIGGEAFTNCTSLTSIDLPAATSIGARAFADCTSLASIDLPAATSIGEYAFSFCDNLTSIDLPAATSIGEGAFYFCDNLTSVDLPAATSIGATAFDSSKSLTAIILRTTETVCVVDFTAIANTPLVDGEGHVYIPAVMYEYYRAGYEPALEAAGAAGFFDILFRKIEDYPEICGTT